MCTQYPLLCCCPIVSNVRCPMSVVQLLPQCVPFLSSGPPAKWFRKSIGELVAIPAVDTAPSLQLCSDPFPSSSSRNRAPNSVNLCSYVLPVARIPETMANCCGSYSMRSVCFCLAKVLKFWITDMQYHFNLDAIKLKLIIMCVLCKATEIQRSN